MAIIKLSVCCLLIDIKNHMKNILLAMLLLPLFSKAQNDVRTALVSKHNGIPVFVMCEPVKEYNVVGAVTDKFRTDTTNTNATTIDALVNNLVAYAIELSKKNKTDFDALLISDGKSASLIKF